MTSQELLIKILKPVNESKAIKISKYFRKNRELRRLMDVIEEKEYWNKLIQMWYDIN